MAALRIGCLFTQAANVDWLRKAQSPYSVNSLAVLAARAAIQDPRFIERYVGEVLAARELLYVGLEKLNIPYIKSQGNFVLTQMGNRAIAIRDGLRERGVLVRDRSYEIAGCVRDHGGHAAADAHLLKELEELWRKK
jgi:histidinol-phosphate aminotransferase